MSRGACSLNTDSRSKKSSNDRLPAPSRENASQMRCLKGFSRSSSSCSMSARASRTPAALLPAAADAAGCC